MGDQIEKKALMTASMASMLDNFNRGNITLLLEMGYKVTLAANFDAGEDSSPLPKLKRFQEEMEAAGCRVVQIDFTRKTWNIRKQLKSYRQLKRLAGEGFDLVHCNSPICAAMTRMAFKKKRKTQGTRVIYTAHGFHFFRGAPVRNWLLYFPVEWVCAQWTDVINTMNREDYIRARRWLKAGKVAYIPGAGIDLERFRPGRTDRKAVRESLGVGDGELLLVSVGELIARKNHSAAIRAVKRLGDGRIRYLICGRGELEEELTELIRRLGMEGQVRLLGYREDIPEICQAADLFVFPSLQEGLPVALLEAMASGTPAVCSDIRGNRELVEEKELRFNPRDEGDMARCIGAALETGTAAAEARLRAVERHRRKASRYRMEKVERKMRREYAWAAMGNDMAAGLAKKADN